MNRITRIAAIALTFAAGSAFADDITIDPTTHLSLKTRAEVRAELAEFNQSGVNPWSRSYNVWNEIESPRSRVDVLAELRRAQADGSMAALTAEDSGAMYLASHGHRIPSQSTLTLASQSLR